MSAMEDANTKGNARSRSLPRAANKAPRPRPRNEDRIRKLLQYAITCPVDVTKRLIASSRNSDRKLMPTSCRPERLKRREVSTPPSAAAHVGKQRVVSGRPAQELAQHVARLLLEAEAVEPLRKVGVVAGV